MIKRQDITRIGKVIKPHGHAGELSVALTSDTDFSGLSFVVMDIDGIFVPFKVTGLRSRGPEAILLTLDGVDSDLKAASLSGKEVFAPTAMLREIVGDDSEGGDTDSDSITVDRLIGFEIVDDDRCLGKVTDIDDSTANILFIVEDSSGNSRMIPLADELIEDIDLDTATIRMNLPEGLLDL